MGNQFTANMPTMEPFVVGEVQVRPQGIYTHVYEKLLELAKLDPPQGAKISFPSKSASDKAIQTLNRFANEDGYYVNYYPYRENEIDPRNPGEVTGGTRMFYLAQPEAPKSTDD